MACRWYCPKAVLNPAIKLDGRILASKRLHHEFGRRIERARLAVSVSGLDGSGATGGDRSVRSLAAASAGAVRTGVRSVRTRWLGGRGSRLRSLCQRERIHAEACNDCEDLRGARNRRWGPFRCLASINITPANRS